MALNKTIKLNFNKQRKMDKKIKGVNMEDLSEEFKKDPVRMECARLVNKLVDVLNGSDNPFFIKMAALSVLHCYLIADSINKTGNNSLIDITIDKLRKTLERNDIDYTGTEIDNRTPEINLSNINEESLKAHGCNDPMVARLLAKTASMMNDGHYSLDTEFVAVLITFCNISAAYTKAKGINPSTMTVKILKWINDVWEQQDLHMNGVSMPIGENRRTEPCI